LQKSINKTMVLVSGESHSIELKSIINTLKKNLSLRVRRASGTVPVWYESVACTGVEKFLTDCPGITALENEFSHVADVYLVCWPGSHSYNGRKERLGRKFNRSFGNT